MAKSNTSAREALEKLNGGPLTFAQMVRAIRETDEVTQDALAERLGVGKSFVSDVENGRRQLSAEKAIEWATALGYPSEMFVQLALQSQLDVAGIRMRVLIDGARLGARLRSVRDAAGVAARQGNDNGLPAPARKTARHAAGGR